MKKTQSKNSYPARKITKSPKKYVFAFGKSTDGDASMRELLGGKGANIIFAGLCLQCAVRIVSEFPHLFKTGEASCV